MRRRPYIDAKFEVVGEAPARPPRWDPLRGLGPFQQLFAVAFMLAGLTLLKWLIWAPLGHFTDWLLALCGIGSPRG